MNLFKRNKKYSISLDGDDWVTPEETLLDSTSQYSDIEKPIPSSIFKFFLILFSVMTSVLASFLFKTAIIDHTALADLAFQNRSANFSLSAPRGIITDRNGQPLLQNIAVFNLLAVSREIKENSESLDEKIKNISDITNQDIYKFNLFIREQIKESATFIAFAELTKDQALAIEYLNPSGFYVIPDTKRYYLDKDKTAQVLGYTGKVSREDLRGDFYYFPTDTIGKLGIEYQYEEFLRGKHGNIFFSKEESGYITKEPSPGKTIMLNIDHDLQIKLHDEIFAVLRESGLSRAAGIAQDPKTGAVLAMVSFPSFDNNIFSSRVSEAEYRGLFENKAKPLFNRVIGGLYNPGSTIKPFIGMTALEERVISSRTTVEDCVSLTVPNPYEPQNPYIFRNWRVEYGFFDLKRAIANSCNIYFFTAGGGNGNAKGLGAERIAKYLKSSFIDTKLGIDLPGEDEGFVPTPEWKIKEKGEPWYLGDTYNISIGQGDLLVTPLWLNSYISAISNGGSIYKPRVANKILGENKEILQGFEPEILSSLPFSQSTIEAMRQAMNETVNSGTAQILKELPVKSAAKTGTAEVIKGKSINSLFTVFAPYEDPKISMTILVEGSASNQGYAIRAAYNVLKWYFSK